MELAYVNGEREEKQDAVLEEENRGEEPGEVNSDENQGRGRMEEGDEKEGEGEPRRMGPGAEG